MTHWIQRIGPIHDLSSGRHDDITRRHEFDVFQNTVKSKIFEVS